MTIDQLLIVLNWVLHFGIPILVALVTSTSAPSTVKALVNLGLSLVGTALLTIIASLASGSPIDWFTIIFAFVTGFFVSGASYARLWKPTGVIAKAAVLGVKSDHTLAS